MSGTTPDQQSNETSLLFLISVVLRHRGLVIKVAATVFVLVAIAVAFRPRMYTASASFMPQSSDRGASSFAGLAAQFGINLSSGDVGESPQFYADLLGSREILYRVIEATYEFEGLRRSWFSSDSAFFSGTLMDLYEVRMRSPGRRLEDALGELRKDMSVRANRETGVISIAVSARWPPLAFQVAERMLELVNEFNMETRQTRAATERRFVEGRLEQVRNELDDSEDALKSFLQQNRDFRDSPFLSFEHDRLQREVLHRQQVVTSIAQSYEQARIDEVRNTPLITVIEQPKVPPVPNPRRRLLTGLIGLALGGVLGLFGAFARDFLRRNEREEPEEYAALMTLRNETMADLRRFLPHRWFRRKG